MVHHRRMAFRRFGAASPGPGPIQRPVSRPWRVASIVVAVAAPLTFTVLGIIGVVDISHQSRLAGRVSGWTQTSGTVVSVRPTCGDGSCPYAATVRFADSSGTFHTFQSVPSDAAPAIGASVQVDYDPTDPTQAHDLSAQPYDMTVQWIAVVFALVAGSSMLILTSVVLGRRWWRSRRLKGGSTLHVGSNA